MRKGSILAILLTGLAGFGIWPNLVGAASVEQVMISEVQISGQSAKDEFVEIYNGGTTDFDLSVCRLNKYSATGTMYLLHRFAGGALIAPQATFVVAGVDYAGSDAVFYSTTQSLADNNSVSLVCNDNVIDLVAWGGVTLYENNPIVATSDLPLWSYQRIKNLDSDDNILDFTIDVPNPGSFVCGVEDVAGGDGVGIISEDATENNSPELLESDEIVNDEMNTDANISSEETVGEVVIVPPDLPLVEESVVEESVAEVLPVEASATETENETVIEQEVVNNNGTSENLSGGSPVVVNVATDSQKVLLNELYPAPQSGEFEYIELYNAEGFSVDLDSWYLTDLSGKKFVLKNIVLLAGEYLSLPYSMTKISLNNDEDQINLYNARGQWRQGVRYAKSVKGKALLLNSDLQWKWGAPSAGLPNVFDAPSVSVGSESESTEGAPQTSGAVNPVSSASDVAGGSSTVSAESVSSNETASAVDVVAEEAPPILESVGGESFSEENEESISSKAKTSSKEKTYQMSALSEWQAWEANDLVLIRARVLIDSQWGITNRCFIAEGNYALPVLCTTLKEKFVLGENIELKAKVYFKNNQFEYLKPLEVDFYDQEVDVTFSADGQSVSEYQLWQDQGVVDTLNSSGRIGRLANEAWVWDFRFPKKYKLAIGDSVAWQAVYYKGENYFIGKSFLFEEVPLATLKVKNILLTSGSVSFDASTGKFIGKFFVERGRKAALVQCLKSL
ncbi:MAG TPA: lamin tail domain-containing protein [bacterium]|nr:lamin tail domain-containing protein [bacterium]